MPRRLHLPTIEQKPKEVLFTEPLSVVVKLTQAQEDFFAEIVAAIVEGRELPEGAYRRSQDRDYLLEKLGVMHLHLVHPGSEELVFLIQYPDHVLIIEIGDHRHFRRPIGAQFERTHMIQVRNIQESRRRRAWLEMFGKLF